MVPKSIIRTFQLIAPASSGSSSDAPNVMKPQTMNSTAEAAATQWRTLGRAIIKT